MVNMKGGERAMTEIEKVFLVSKFQDAILELVEDQLRNDADTLTQSDLQGRAGAIVMTILAAGKKLAEAG